MMIEIKNLTKSYLVNKKENVILDNISFTLPNDGLFYIVGKSGCGKSSLLNILEGIDKKYKGEVIINNKNIKNLKEKSKRNFFKDNIGIIFQTPNLFNNLTVIQNLNLICLIKGSNKRNIDNLLKKYNLIHLKNNKVGTLSLGEKQRLSLIRSIINNPNIIFADEPTGALDALNAKIIMNDLKELSKDHLVVVVTHSLELISTFKGNIIELKDKKVFYDFKINKENNKYQKDINIKEKDFSNIFLFDSLKKNKTKNIITCISLVFGFASIFCSVGLSLGFSNKIEELYSKNINCNVYKIYKNDYEYGGNKNLNIIKKVRPSFDNVNIFLSSYKVDKIVYNLDYLIEGIEIYINDIKSEGIVAKFYYENSYNNVIKISNLKEKNIEKIELKIDKEVEFRDKTTNVKSYEKLNFKLTYIEYEKIKEFEFLNDCSVYLPYDYFVTYFNTLKADNISESINKDVTFYDLVKFSNESTDLSGYSLYVLINKDDAVKVRNLSKNIENLNKPLYKINNEFNFLVDNFIALLDSLSLGIKFFVIIIVLCNIFLIGFLTYFKIKNDRKNIAVLRVLGAKDDYINNIYLNEGLMNYFISLGISLIIFYLLKYFLNMKLYDFFIISNFIYIPIKYMFSIIIISLVVLILTFYVILLQSKKINLKEELKEE